MVHTSFTSFQEQIRDEQEQYCPYREFFERERRQQYRQYPERVRQIGLPSQPQTQGGPETNGASRNQRRRGRGRGWGRGRGRGVQSRGRQGH